MLSNDILAKELYPYRGRWLPEPLLADLKWRYGVSLRTVILRAAQKDFITKKQCGQQIGVLNKKYGSDQEQPELPKPEGLNRLERLTYLALIKEELTISRAAEILGKPLLDVRNKLAQWLEDGSD